MMQGARRAAQPLRLRRCISSSFVPACTVLECGTRARSGAQACSTAHAHTSAHAPWVAHAPPWRTVHTRAAGGGHSSAAGDSELASEGVSSLKRKVDAASARLDDVLRVFDLEGSRAAVASLEHDASAEDAWDDAAAGQALLTRLNTLRSDISEVERLQASLEEAQFALDLVEAESGPGSPPPEPEILREGLSTLAELDAALDAWEARRLLSGPYDECGARLSINAGAGGVDAMDWADMMQRMYLRWAERQGYSARVVECQPGDEAGIKGCELEISGRYAYGYLRGEKGTHRMVRNSPFNAKGLRQTNFAGVEVLPILDSPSTPVKAQQLDIPDADLEISFQRSGGKGGQNVNKVETGVRIVHVPTGLAVKCTQERTQLANRAIAMDMLRAKLLVVLEEQQAAQIAEIRGDIVKAEWGQQIRNYVLHPYRMVKDARTGMETADVQGVLDGGLDQLMTAYLRQKGQRATEEALSQA